MDANVCLARKMIFSWDNFPSESKSVGDIEEACNISPSMARRSRETHRCSRNLMTSNIDRRRILNFSYSVVIWLKMLAAGWSIVSVELELWRVCVNGMMPTFGAVTFFMSWRWWKMHEMSHFPEIDENFKMILMWARTLMKIEIPTESKKFNLWVW